MTQGFRVELAGRELAFVAAADASLLASAEQAGFRIRRSCTAGTCGICFARLLKGTVRILPGDYSLSADTQPGCEILCCLATPQSDCMIEVPNVLAPGEYPVSKVACQVAEVRPLSPDIKQVFLRLPAGKKITYRPGHYLDVLLDANTACPFSIANAPGSDRILELHVRRTPESALSTQLDALWVAGQIVHVQFPKGRCLLPDNALSGPLLFIAGSTGFSPIKAMLEECFRHPLKHKVALYWGGRRPADIYLHEMTQEWARTQPLFAYHPIVSEPQPSDHWQGRVGLVHQAVLADLPSLAGWRIVVGGSPAMVYRIYDDFIAAGMTPDQMLSDVFDYAPR